MSQELWSSVDRFLADQLIPDDPVLERALADIAAAGLPAISVSPSQGKFLNLLALLIGARSILEIGTLGGYSTIWLARALPEGGRLITLESDPMHAEVARANIARAGLADVVNVRLGRALETLPRIEAEGLGPFGLVFIDADKVNTPDYFTWALRLTQPGSLILIDNVVRKGAVADPSIDSPDVLAMRRVLAMLAAEPRVRPAALQTVGSKGYDGFAAALVVAEGDGR
jgi:predicted O-methyltransferase YrrM